MHLKSEMNLFNGERPKHLGIHVYTGNFDIKITSILLGLVLKVLLAE